MKQLIGTLQCVDGAMKIIEKPYFYPVFIVVVGIAVFANSFNNGFAFDDWPLVVHNPLVQQLDLGAIFSSSYWVGHPEYGLYRPLTTWSYAVNRALLGDGAFGFHLVNVLLHIVNALLLYHFLLGCLSRHGAGVAALLFLLHPIQTEAVNSIVGRAELLVCFWVLIGLITYANGRWMWTAVALFFGCLCKEHAATLLGLVVVYDLWKNQRLGTFLPYGIFVCAIGLFLLVRYWVVDAVLLPVVPAFVDNPLAHVSSAERLLTAMSIVGRYIGLLIWPIALSADYSFQAIPALDSPWNGFLGLACLVGLAGIGVVVLAFKKTISATPALALGFVLIPFLPVSNLLFPIGTVMAERLLYVPMVGAVMLLGVGVQAAVSRFRLANVCLVVLILGGCAARTVARNTEWQSNLTLFESAVQTVPKSAKAHFNLGHELHDLGEVQKALRHYQEAIKIYPTYAEVHYNIGVLYQENAEKEHALRAYRQTVEIDSTHVNAWVNTGVLLAEKGASAEAIDVFTLARRLAPKRVDIHYNLALVCQNSKQWDQAIDHYRAALALNSEYEDAAFNLGIILERQHQHQEAVAVLLEAVKQPGERGDLALFAVGRLYIKLGDKRQAKSALESFIGRWKGQIQVRQQAEKWIEQLRLD